MSNSNTILVAPLNWGLGHATRCIPIIHALLKHNFDVLLASDGASLKYLQKEFPELDSIELPSYNISYTRNPSLLKLQLAIKLPHIYRTMKAEKKITENLVENKSVIGIISDNRLGVRSNKVTSVYITHQVNVVAGWYTKMTSAIHQRILKKFDYCWVPDNDNEYNLSGKLSKSKNPDLSLNYIGPLSRFKQLEIPFKYDILALLSGPEPQRTIFEEKVVDELKDTNSRTLLVQGIIEDKQKTTVVDNITRVNYMQTTELEKVINQSKLVLARSGYTTIMDLAILGKKAFFVPTPGQSEQEYLAKRLDSLGIVPSCKQKEFKFSKLKEIDNYRGLGNLDIKLDYTDLFSLLKRK